MTRKFLLYEKLKKKSDLFSLGIWIHRTTTQLHVELLTISNIFLKYFIKIYLCFYIYFLPIRY